MESFFLLLKAVSIYFSFPHLKQCFTFSLLARVKITELNPHLMCIILHSYKVAETGQTLRMDY